MRCSEIHVAVSGHWTSFVAGEKNMTQFDTPPPIGLGTYPLAGEDATTAVKMSIEVGYRHIDTAQMYGNEKAVGKGVRDCGVARDDIYVVTKVDPGNVGAGRFEQTVEQSIDDLGSAPDLLLIHWPPAEAEFDAALDRLIYAKARGWAKAIGVSNYSASMMKRAQARAEGALICNQVEFHPLLDQRKILAAAKALNMVVTAYSPLARGAACKPKIVQDIAARLDRPASEIVLRWIVQQGVVAIPKTSQRENAVSNLNALSFELSPEDMKAISTLGTVSGRTIDPSWMKGRWD
jgi:2,5-diketo-D-gluconate reductase B